MIDKATERPYIQQDRAMRPARILLQVSNYTIPPDMALILRDSVKSSFPLLACGCDIARCKSPCLRSLRDQSPFGSDSRSFWVSSSTIEANEARELNVGSCSLAVRVRGRTTGAGAVRDLTRGCLDRLPGDRLGGTMILLPGAIVSFGAGAGDWTDEVEDEDEARDEEERSEEARGRIAGGGPCTGIMTGAERGAGTAAAGGGWRLLERDDPRVGIEGGGPVVIGIACGSTTSSERSGTGKSAKKSCVNIVSGRGGRTGILGRTRDLKVGISRSAEGI
jgi:hypothetical protein